MQSQTSSPSTGVLLLAGLALFSFSQGAGAQITQPLTPEQVQCSADQLRTILGRSAIFFGPGYNERTATFLFTYDAPAGELSGLALLEQYDKSGEISGPERQLAFAVAPGRVRLRRNPTKPQSVNYFLLRDSQSTDNSRLEDPHAMAVVLDPTMNPQKNQDFSTLLVVDNLSLQDGGMTSDNKIGPGLRTILGRCTATFTRADLHVFNVLGRMLRATAWSTRRSDRRAEQLHKLAAIYRGAGAEPIAGGVRTAYRIDFYPLSKTTGRVSLELLVDIGDDGTLGDAMLRVLPPCTADGELGCSTSTSEVAVSVIRPVFGRRTWNPDSSPAVCWKGPSNCPAEVSFSFAERLEGTSWLKP